MNGKEWHVATKGDFLTGFPLKIDGEKVSGSLWCAGEDDGARDFAAFYPYTSVEGFAAYETTGANARLILVNYSEIQFIYFK